MLNLNNIAYSNDFERSLTIYTTSPDNIPCEKAGLDSSFQFEFVWEGKKSEQFLKIQENRPWIAHGLRKFQMPRNKYHPRSLGATRQATRIDFAEDKTLD